MTSPIRRRGASLLELLVALVMVVIALNLGAILVLMAMRVDQMSAETMHRLTRQSQLADLFRDDVHSTVATPETWAEFRAGPACLILQQPENSWVVYQFTKGVIEQTTQKGESRTRRPILLGPAERIVEFGRTSGQQPVITMRITEQHKGITGLTREIAAAVGGDLR